MIGQPRKKQDDDVLGQLRNVINFKFEFNYLKKQMSQQSVTQTQRRGDLC